MVCRNHILWTGYRIFFFASCIAWSMEHGQKTGHASARTLFGETTTAVKRVLLLAPNYLAANNRNSCKAIVLMLS